MTTTAVSADGAATPKSEIEERLDRIAAQLEVLTAELERQRLEREKWRELQEDAMPIARAALASVGTELESLQGTLTPGDLRRLVRKIAGALPALEAGLGQLESIGELAEDAGPLVRPAFTALSERLAALDAHGYFTFARAGMGVVDRIVTSFSEEDVQALGENVVLILQTVRDMTQPEMMGFVRRTIQSVQEEAAPAEAPSLLGLLREMRDPQVRRGFARALGMIRSMSEAEATAGDAGGATTNETTSDPDRR